jgi:hypothetical protein
MTRWIGLHFHFTALVACFGLSGAGRADAGPTPPQSQKLVELVRRLGDSDFRAREEASRELFAIGLAAKEALLEGAKDPDLEVRRRCRGLLPEILEADRQAKLAAFIADREGKLAHDLPGWERYRKIAGEDAAARALFVEIQKNDTGFLRDAEQDPGRAGEQCAGLCQDLFQKLYGGPFVGNRPVRLAELAPLLLVAADPKVRVPLQQRYLISTFLYQPETRSALAGGSPSPFKKSSWRGCTGRPTTSRPCSRCSS